MTGTNQTSAQQRRSAKLWRNRLVLLVCTLLPFFLYMSFATWMRSVLSVGYESYIDFFQGRIYLEGSDVHHTINLDAIPLKDNQSFRFCQGSPTV